MDVFQKPATGASRPSLKDAKRRHYMQILFIVLQAAQILPWSGCCSPQQLPSKVYARGFLINSLRAAVSAALFTTAVGKLNTNLQGSICCPGGPERRTDSVCFTLGDAAFAPERLVSGWRVKNQPNRQILLTVRCVSLGFL